MCFSIGQSAVMCSVAAFAAVMLHITGRPAKYVVLPGYFALMEGLQVLQYLVLDDCSSKANQLWMYLGLVHMAFQPLVANWALFTTPRPIALGKLSPPFTYPMALQASVRICAAAAVLLLIKYIPALVALLSAQQLLTNALAPYLPARVLSALATNTCRTPELGCGAKLCSTVGKYHLAWYAPQMGSGYYVPSFFMHCFAMFGPSLLFGSTYHRLVMLLVFVSGPLLSEYIMWGGSLDVRAHEWQGVWCLFSAAQVLGALGIEVIANGILNNRWVPPKKGDAPANDYDDAAANRVANGVVNGFHQNGAVPKKHL